MQPRLFVHQKLTMVRNTYRVFGVGADGAEGELMGVAKQKRIALKEKLPFYGDEQSKDVSFSVKAEKVLDIHGRYLVLDSTDTPVGAFKKSFAESLAVSTWVVLGPQGETLYTATESNVTRAVMRRYAGNVPFIGMLLQFVMLFLRYHFDIKDSAGTLVGRYDKVTLFRDRYRLDLTDEAWARVDARTWAGLAVGLDAFQSR